MDERMEAIMRKLTAMALSMMFILGSVIPVGAEETQIRQTKISVSIDPVYTVTIPANTTILPSAFSFLCSGSSWAVVCSASCPENYDLCADDKS